MEDNVEQVHKTHADVGKHPNYKIHYAEVPRWTTVDIIPRTAKNPPPRERGGGL